MCAFSDPDETQIYDAKAFKLGSFEEWMKVELPLYLAEKEGKEPWIKGVV